MRTAIGFLLRLFSYLFELILSLFLAGIAFVALSDGKPLKLGMLPWEGMRLDYWVLGLGVAGVLLVFLAAIGPLRYVFPLWTLFVFIMMLRGFFLTTYQFSGDTEFRGAAWLTFGAFGAFLASLSCFDSRRRSRS